MAVAEMEKLNLAAMSYDKDAILNALQRTSAVEVKFHSEAENTAAISADCEGLRAYLAKTEDALSLLTSAAEKFNKENKLKSVVLKDGFEVSYTEFTSAKDMKGEVDSVVAEINSLSSCKNEALTELSKIERTLLAANIYSSVRQPLKTEDTAHVQFRLGTVPAASREELLSALDGVGLAAYETVASDRDNLLIFVAMHKCAASETEAVLQNFGFISCPFDDGRSGENVYLDLTHRAAELKEKSAVCDEKMSALTENIRMLKIYCDYLAFELEKAELNEKLRSTQTAFLLEAFVPKDSEQTVAEALESVSGAVYYEFSALSEGETPPTLLRNNKVIKNFETITNMYSPPAPREFDPNTVMAFFYSVFLGFIMADIGYGLLMILGGGYLYLKNSRRENTIGKLGGVFATGGIFTIIWGLLFNSFFGFSLLPFTVMPDLKGSDMSWSFAGIKVPALLIISMIIGVVQIFTGYVCRTVQCWRRGKTLDGIFDGLVWAVFSVGVELAILGFVEEFNMSALKIAGGIIAGASLVIAILTAGRKEKLLGKFTKGFGSAYGVINYASDILSYARLYGLMLAGAVIAEIITDNSVNLITSGNGAFIIIGVLIMVVGHVFNLAIGLLGAYIHDARLQYVEFYGRFYEGDGKLFTPFGSEHRHVYISGLQSTTEVLNKS